MHNRGGKFIIFFGDPYGAGGIPASALLDEDGQALLDEDGNYLLEE